MREKKEILDELIKTPSSHRDYAFKILLLELLVDIRDILKEGNNG